MKPLFLTVLVLAIAIAARPLVAQEPKPNTPQLVASLVAQLDDAAPDVRQRAQDRLVDLGPDAEAAVRAVSIDDNAGPEARSSAAAALERIQRNRELHASRTITASFKDAKPQDVFAEIARQANTKVLEQTPYVWTKTPKAVSLDIDHEPFWVAMHKACAATQIQPYTMMGGSGDIHVWINEPAKGKWTDRPFVTSGTFMIVADEVRVSHWDELRTPPSPTTQFQLDLTVLPDPHLQILHRAGTAILDDAIDDRGNSLLPPKNDGSGHAPGESDGWAYEVNAYLTYPKQPGDRIARIIGHVPFLTVLRTEPWEIGDPLHAKEQTHRVSGRDFTIKSVQRVGNALHAIARVHLTGANAEAWQRVFTQPNTRTLGSWLRLVDAAGKTIARGEGSSSTTFNNNLMEFQVRFTDLPVDVDAKAMKIVWNVPAEVRELDVPFEFTNLPMPK